MLASLTPAVLLALIIVKGGGARAIILNFANISNSASKSRDHNYAPAGEPSQAFTRHVSIMNVTSDPLLLTKSRHVGHSERQQKRIIFINGKS